MCYGMGCIYEDYNGECRYRGPRPFPCPDNKEPRYECSQCGWDGGSNDVAEDECFGFICPNCGAQAREEEGY